MEFGLNSNNLRNKFTGHFQEAVVEKVSFSLDCLTKNGKILPDIKLHLLSDSVRFSNYYNLNHLGGFRYLYIGIGVILASATYHRRDLQ